MALNICKKKYKGDISPIFLISANCHPQNIAVCQQRAEPQNITVRVIKDEEFDTALKEENVFGALLQYPDTYGHIYENLQSLTDLAHSNNVQMIAATDLMSCTLLKPPGEYGIDLVVGNTQRFGVPLGFGGPHAAFLACDEKNVRKLPGRLIGITKDSRNKAALRMALQTREQFIRRDKATSNICTAQALLANVAAAYAVYHGPHGIKNIAQRIHSDTQILAKGLQPFVVNGTYFDTITLRVDDSESILNKAYAANMNFRYIDSTHLSISLDETTTLKDIEAIWKVFGVDNLSASEFVESKEEIIPSSIQRTSKFLQHETFNSYHSETALMRYLYSLERKDLGLNTAMMPLGSCTMKLNSASVMLPVTWECVNNIHPFVPLNQVEGYLELIKEMESWLQAVTGFDAVSLQPNRGAAGEYTGLSAIRAYHKSQGESHRNICLIPTSAHGTNPASAAMCGYKIVAITCDDEGYIDMCDLKTKAELHRDNLAACMITYPSTHGVFEDNIIELIDCVHDNGGLVYMDGANLQAQLTKTSPGKIGADVCHLNLHKTFCIPHGGGGPGLGPIACNEKLKPFLPTHPVIASNTNASAIGPVSAAPWSSASILVIPWMYIRMMGYQGLEKATCYSILNANYMAKRLEEHYKILFRRNNLAAHEFIIDCSKFYKKDPDNSKKYVYKIGAEDVAKRLCDFSFHAPTMSWPVVNTLMVEPTESEPLEELDRFCDAMIAIRNEIKDVEDGKLSIEESPLRNAPHTADIVMSDEWNRKYSRKTAAVNPYKGYWPSVGRVDNEYGDRNKICACPSVEDIMRIQEEEEKALKKQN